MPITPLRSAAFDPYGQPIPVAHASAHPAERRLRLPALLFWAAALALLAGRLALPVQPAASPATTAVTQAVATPS